MSQVSNPSYLSLLLNLFELRRSQLHANVIFDATSNHFDP